MTGVQFGNIRFDEDNKPRLSTKLLGSIDAGELVDNLVKAREIPITTKVNENEEITEKFAAIDEFESKVQALGDAMEGLRRPSPLSGISDVFATRQVVGISGTQEAINSVLLTPTNAAKVGNFSLTVHQLASQEARATRQHTSETASLIEAGEAGKLVINGAELEVNEGDSLRDIADNINNNSSALGAVAEVIKLDEDNYRLFVSNVTSGERLKIEAVDANVTTPATTALADKLGFLTTTVTSKTGQKREIDQNGAVTLIDGAIRPDPIEDMSLKISVIDYSSGAAVTKEETVTIQANASGTIEDVISAINLNELGIQAESYTDKEGIEHLRFRSQSDSVSISGFEGATLTDDRVVSIDSNGNPVTVGQVDAGDVLNILGLALDTSGAVPETLQDLRLSEEFMAKVEYNGLTAVRDSNKFRDLIPEVTVELFAATGEEAEIGIQNNIDGAFNAIENFVNAFNDLYKHIEFHSQADEEGKVHEDAILNQSSLLRSVRAELTRIISSTAFGSTSGTRTSLGDAGITINSRNRGIGEEDPGILEFDLNALYDALTEDFEGVRQVFSFVPATGTNPNFSIIDRPEVIAGETSQVTIETYVRDVGEQAAVTFNQGIDFADLVIGDTLDLSAEPGTRSVDDRIRLYIENNRSEFIDLVAIQDSADPTKVKYEITNVTGDSQGVTNMDAVYHQKEVLVGPKNRFGDAINTTYDVASSILTTSVQRELTVTVSETATASYNQGDLVRVGDESTADTNNYFATVQSYDSTSGELKLSLHKIGGFGGTGDLVIQGASVTQDAQGKNVYSVNSASGTQEASFVEVETKNYQQGEVLEIGQSGDADNNYYRGKVESYDYATGELKINVDASVTKGSGATGDVSIRPMFGEISNTSGNIRGSDVLDGFVIAYTGSTLFPGETQETTGLSFSRGIADQASSTFENWLLQAAGGLFFEERESLKTTRDRNLTQIERLEDQLDQYRNRMETQFANVERQLAALASTQATIEQFTNSGRDS